MIIISVTLKSQIFNNDLFFSLEGRISDIVHSAFWDCLREQLSCSPPDYVHAVILLQEVKTVSMVMYLY